MEDHVGFGALAEALQDLESQGFERILIVVSEAGWRRFTAGGDYPLFTKRTTHLFTSFSPNPDFSEILAGVEVMKEFTPDLLVAIGGGSPIDVAKMIKAIRFTKEPYDPDQPELVKPSGEGPPLVAIATTSGSGAEATQFAVFYVNRTKKQSMTHPTARPEMAVVDPEMTYHLPPAITASSGLDALAQGVEAFWSSNTTPEAQEYATATIKYALDNLYNAVHNPAPDNRYHMAQAAYLSGKAINITRTTLPHALGYHLTTTYGIPHGHAVALTIPYFFRLNFDASLAVNSPLGPEGQRQNMERLVALMGQKTGDDCFVFWRNLMTACGLPSTLREIGVDSEDKVRAFVASVDFAKTKNHLVAIPADTLVQFILANP
ncbi:MAG: phosphonoacetaldehyde reductase [Planctomycetaceae bacterium]|nr:phosphonoacetaldehyde reductase [Planctomycetaceae bacterium]